MWNKSIKFAFGFAVLQTVGQFFAVESQRTASKSQEQGNEKVFAAGVLLDGIGVLSGDVLTHITTNNTNNKPQETHQHHRVADPTATVFNNVITSHIPHSPPPPTPAKRISTIETGEILTNGCYKLTIREPDQHDVTRYTEREELICPPKLPTQSAPTVDHLVPVVTIQQGEPVAPLIHMITVPVYINPAGPHEMIPNSKTNNGPTYLPSTPEPVHTAPLAHLQPNPFTSVQPFNVVPALPVAPVPNNSLIHQPAIVQPIQPVANPAPVSTGVPQVVVLSKPTGVNSDEKKKKSAANTLLANVLCFLLSAIVITGFI